MGKVKNFQEEFSFDDVLIAYEAAKTYNCGMSRIALRAPDQIYKIGRSLMPEPRSHYAHINVMTLKLFYAIQVWCKAALISAENPNDLMYYWWLHWKSDNGPFNTIEYSNFYRDITIEQLLDGFWKLLEQIADSGEIKVSEGYWIRRESKSLPGDPKIVCDLVLNGASAREVERNVSDVYRHPYNKELVSYKWADIKDFFVELTLDQLRLTMPDKLHNHTELDDTLLRACSNWDVEQINLALKNGANINCLDNNGESVLVNAIQHYREQGMRVGEKYTDEETKTIEKANEQKCKEIVDLLLSLGADINLFGFEGLPPLDCEYYDNSPEMVDFLLKRGASPNLNSYSVDDIYCQPYQKNVRSSVLDLIDKSLYEEYDDDMREIDRLIHAAGGRLYVWDYTPWDEENIGRYVVEMMPSGESNLFVENSGWPIGTASQLTIEGRDGIQTVISLESLSDELEQWGADYRNNLDKHYNWLAWKQRGLDLARRVAQLLPDSVALFCMYNNNQVIKKYDSGEVYLCNDGGPIRIK